MKKFLVFASLVVLIAACSKDKFETKPQLSLKSISGNYVPDGGNLNILLEYTDKEGDVQDTLYLTRQRINRRGPLSLKDVFKMPAFPDNSKGEINLNFNQAGFLSAGMTALNIPGGGNAKEPDSLILKFVLKDKAGNKSDTLFINDIVVQRF